MPHHDVLIIGSGLSAATLALSLPESLRVVVATKKRAEDSSSFWAQGGIAAVMGQDDSFDEHVRDTLVAGEEPELCRRLRAAGWQIEHIGNSIDGTTAERPECKLTNSLTRLRAQMQLSAFVAPKRERERERLEVLEAPALCSNIVAQTVATTSLMCQRHRR